MKKKQPEHPPAFQFYANDFSSSATVEAMSTLAVGAYTLLLCKAWYQDPVGTIPDNDDVLSKWARVSRREWMKIRGSVLAAFVLIDGRWHQKRMQDEWNKLLERREERAQSGSRGAKKRWQDDGNGIAELSRSNGNSRPDPMADDASSSSSSFSFSSSDSNPPPPPPSGFLPNGDVDADVVHWGAAAEELKRLKISKRESTIKTAIANGFNPPQVIAIVGYLLSVPADKCSSPGGALCDRLGNPDAAEWLVDDGWPWRTIIERTPTTANGRPVADAKAEEQAANERRALERERLDGFADQLAEMSDEDLRELIELAPKGSRPGILSALESKGRDCPLIRDVLLDLIGKTQTV